MSDRLTRQILNDLQAKMAESKAQIAAILARLRGPNTRPRDEPPEPSPFRPARGMRLPALPSDPLDAVSRPVEKNAA